jgi:hypothetical protein
MDVIAEGCGLAEEERMRKEAMAKELERILLLEEVSWRWKSKALWLREGDQKTHKKIKNKKFIRWLIPIEEITKWNL